MQQEQQDVNITSFERKREKECPASLEITARAMAVIFEELPEGLDMCMSEEGSGEIECAEKPAS